MAAVFAGVAGTLIQAQHATQQAAVAEAQRNRADIAARTATEERDVALRAQSRTAAINDFNAFLLFDAAPSGKPFTVGDLLARAEGIASHQPPESDANRADLLLAIGNQYQRMDEDNKARELLQQAYDVSRKLQDRSTRGRAACGLAQVIARTGDRGRTETLFLEGLADLPDEPSYAPDRIGCLLTGSDAARQLGDAAAAVARAESARELAGKLAIPSKVLEARVWDNLAESYRVAGMFAQADPAFAVALEQLKALGRENTQSAGTLLNNWGVLLMQIGQPLRAEVVLRQAIEISRSDAMLGKVSPMLLSNYAHSLVDLDRIVDGSRYANLAYAEARRAGDQVVVNMALLVRASADRERGDLAGAGQRLAEVEPRLAAMLPRDHLAFAALALQYASLAAAKGDFAAAMDNANRAVEIAERGRAHLYARVHFLTKRAELEFDLQRFDQAKVDATAAVGLAEKVVPAGTPSSIAGAAYLALGRALLARNDPERAHGAFVSALEQLQPTLGADHAQTRLARKLATSIRDRE